MQKMVQRFHVLMASKKLLFHIDDEDHRLYMQMIGFSQFVRDSGGQISFTPDEIEFLDTFRARLMWRIFGVDFHTMDDLLDELDPQA